MRDRMSEIFWHPVTAASRAPRFLTTWPRNDGLWGREWFSPLQGVFLRVLRFPLPTKLDTSKSKVDIWKWPLSWGHLESHCQVSSLRASSPFSASETGREKTRERTAKLWGVGEKRAPRFRFSFRVPLTRNFSRLSQMESLLNVLLAK